LRGEILGGVWRRRGRKTLQIVREEKEGKTVGRWSGSKKGLKRRERGGSRERGEYAGRNIQKRMGATKAKSKKDRGR